MELGSSGKKLTCLCTLGVVVPDVAIAATVEESLRGLLPSLGGLSPAYWGSRSPLSTFWAAMIICSKMARVGDRQASHVQEESPVQGWGLCAREPAPAVRGILQLAKLTWEAGVLVNVDISLDSWDVTVGRAWLGTGGWGYLGG